MARAFKPGDRVVLKKEQQEATQRRAKRGKKQPPKLHRFDPHAMERYGMKHGEAYEVVEASYDRQPAGVTIRVGDCLIGPLAADRFVLEVKNAGR
jgi:hypothetical protein